MKNKDILRELGEVDEKYIIESDPTAPIAVNKKKRRLRALAVIAACVSVMLLAVLAVVPYLADEYAFRENLPDELKDYADSDYIKLMYLIEKYDPKSNSWSSYNDSWEAMEGDSNKGGYVEVTDNQTESVIEGDLFKRSDKNIYYYDEDEDAVLVYSIAGESSALVAKYELDLPDHTKGQTLIGETVLYLSEDCETLTLVCNYNDFEKYYNENSYYHKVVVSSFDVSDPSNITKKKEVLISGKNYTSRVIDGKVYLVNTYFPQNVDYADEATYLPQIDTGEGFESIPNKDIVMPEVLKTWQSTVVIRLDEESLAVESALEVFTPPSNFYFSRDTLYIASNYQENFDDTYDGKECVVRKRMTDIVAIDISKKKLKYIGGISIDGITKNQYCFDEYDGVLRVVTETASTAYIGGTWNRIFWTATDEDSYSIYSGRNAALYCIDKKTWEIVGEVRDFAPKGESVESVRFDGTNAYVCTAVVTTFTDPVYFFDLSDMSNITYTETGKIDGYSSSLVDFGEGLLLGIGCGDAESTLKIEMYTEAEDKVESVCKYEKANVDFSSEYKSYYINRENGLVGMVVVNTARWKEEQKTIDTGYLLLRYNGEGFEEALHMRSEDFRSDLHVIRSTVIDEYCYVFYFNRFYVTKLS